MRERTFVMLKPDAIQRCLMGNIVSRLENRGLKTVAMKFLVLSEAQAAEHYAEHVGKPFYPGLLEYIRSGPVLAMVWEGDNAVNVARQVMGDTRPFEAGPGTVRGDFGLEIGRNIVHGADKVESAQREMAIYFSPEELVNWTRIDDKWLYE